MNEPTVLDTLKLARRKLVRIYSHYSPPEVASAPAGSQLSDWRDGMAALRDAIDRLEIAQTQVPK